MPEQYDDDRPTHRWVMVGYALTEDRKLDRNRINNPHPELLPADEAKRIVTNHHGRYASDAEIAAAEAASAGDSQLPPVTEAAEGEQPDGTASAAPPEVPTPTPKPGPTRVGWGAKADGETAATSTEGK